MVGVRVFLPAPSRRLPVALGAVLAFTVSVGAWAAPAWDRDGSAASVDATPDMVSYVPVAPVAGSSLFGGAHTAGEVICDGSTCTMDHTVVFAGAGTAAFSTVVDPAALQGPPLAVECGGRQLTGATNHVAARAAAGARFETGFARFTGTTTQSQVVSQGGAITCVDVGGVASDGTPWRAWTQHDGSVRLAFG